jgi:aldehyde dehydrogenase (NAD+)
VLEFIEDAQKEGATILAQAALPEDPELDGGYYVPPTVFGNVDPGMRIACEEVFGPIVAPIPFSDEKEAIRLANDTEYGLAASVWTTDVNRAHRVAHNIEAGIMCINHPTRSRQGLPFGGYKKSGMGRKKGLGETMREYTQVKSIQMDLTDETFSFSYGNR